MFGEALQQAAEEPNIVSRSDVWVFLAIVSALAVPFPFVRLSIRRLVFEGWRLSAREPETIPARIFDSLQIHCGWIELGLLFALFQGSVLLVTLLIDASLILEGVALGIGLVYLQGVHLPRLLPPEIHAGFHTSDGKVLKTGEPPVRKIEVAEGGPHLIGVAVTNLGVNHCEQCIYWILLPQDLEPVTDPQFYEGVELYKPFEYQTDLHQLLFKPGAAYLDLPPGNRIVIPLYVNVRSRPSRPENGEDVEMKVRLCSRDRGGATVAKLKLRIRRKD